MHLLFLLTVCCFVSFYSSFARPFLRNISGSSTQIHAPAGWTGLCLISNTYLLLGLNKKKLVSSSSLRHGCTRVYKSVAKIQVSLSWRTERFVMYTTLLRCYSSCRIYIYKVGKTSLITRFMYDTFDNTYQASNNSLGSM